MTPRDTPVLLLHGFPDLPLTWRPQVAALAAAGFRTHAPPLRGYLDAPRPAHVADYAIDHLVADAESRVRSLGGRAHVVGHDWGGMIAWHLASRHPELVDRLVVMNAPHPARFARALRTPRQALRSWYALAFQLPWLPERLIAADGGALVRRSVRRATRPGAFTEAELDALARALATVDAARAAIACYRAAFRAALRGVARPRTRVERPTLLVWGMRDPFLGPELTEGLEDRVLDLRVERVAEAGHWVHRDAAARVNGVVLEFLRG